MTLVIAMLVLSSVFMFVMAHSLIQGHNSIAFEFSLKSKLSNLYAQSEDEQVENYGKAHVIVMDLANALGNNDKVEQFKQTQIVFAKAELYVKVINSSSVQLYPCRNSPALRVVK